MGDDITVLSGRAIEIDTSLLRTAASLVDDVAARVREAAARFSDALWQQQSSICSGYITSGQILSGDTTARADATARIADNLRYSADLYEAVELTLEGNARGCTPGSLDRLADIYREHPFMRSQVDRLVRLWRSGVGAEVFDQLLGSRSAWTLGPILWMAASLTVPKLRVAIGALNRGAVPRGTQVLGPLPSVTVTRLGAGTSVMAPRGFADVTDRIPASGPARVGVEIYTGKDGEQVAFVLIGGTRPDGPEDEAWSWEANMPLYAGREASTSYAAVIAALEASGVEPGSRIALAGHSQGAMIAELIAAGGKYDVAYAQSMGSPTEADVPENTTHVQFAHEDDPVPTLANGGMGRTSGSENSAIVTRVADPMGGLGRELEVPAHQLAEYRETAVMADDSNDPRLIASREELRWLTNGESGVRYEYGASVDD